MYRITNIRISEYQNLSSDVICTNEISDIGDSNDISEISDIDDSNDMSDINDTSYIMRSIGLKEWERVPFPSWQSLEVDELSVLLS
jgi:hypothetical protein